MMGRKRHGAKPLEISSTPLQIPSARLFRLAQGTLQGFHLPHSEIFALMGSCYVRPDNRHEALLQELTGALLGSGTQSKDATSYSEKLEGLGASLSMECNNGYLAFEIIGRTADFLELADLLCESLTRPRFEKINMLATKRRLAAEAQYRSLSSQAMAEDAISRLLYHETDSRYVDDTPTRISALEIIEVDDASNCHRDLLNRSPLNIVIAGGVDPSLAADKLSQWLPSPAYQGIGNSTARLRPPSGQRRAHTVIPGGQCAVMLGHQVRLCSTHPDYLAAHLINDILGGTFNSRLVKAIREERGLSYGVRSELRCRDPELDGHWHAQLSPDLIDLEEGITVAEEVISHVSASEVTYMELESRKAACVGRLLIETSSLSGLCSVALASMEQGYGLDPDYVRILPEKINKIGADDINRVLVETFQKQQLLVAIAGPDFNAA